MIKFIDIESGNVFDGQMPYVHWFDEAQSVNLIYSKKLFVISNYRELVIGMPNTGVFDILKTDVIDDFAENLPNLSTYELYDNLYLKIDREKEVRTEIQDNEEVEVDIRKTACADLVDDGTAMQYRSIGTQYRNGRYYIHRFYIIAKSQFAGEYVEEFVLMTENESEVIKCKIGADFYNEDERLGINLKNFGMEAPSLVQKAIYEGNVHEEFQDNVLINRKWKELLINYQDCLMCKGSYKSLLNCLEWFGYGDNIRLLEYWRNAYDDGTLFEDEIKDTFYNVTKEMLKSNAKTTYIGILLATQKIDPDSDTRYDPYEPIPLVVEKENLLYTISDLCLKMTLLGNFFSTYFMPIHLDLIHCSIEHLVYSTTIKIIAEGENKRVDFNDSNEELLVEVDSKFKLGDVHTHVYVDTYNQVDYNMMHAEEPGHTPDYRYQTGTFANKIVYDNIPKSLGGVETEIRDYYVFTSEYQAAQYGAQMYGGPGCIVQFKCYVPNINDTSNCLVNRIIMRIESSESENVIYEDILTNIRPYSDDTYVPETDIRIDRSIKLDWLFKEWGNYKVTLIFHTNTGKDYMKIVNFVIDEDVFNSMIVKKVQKRPGTELFHLTNFILINDLFSYSMTNEDVPEGAEFYSQYFYTGSDIDAIGTNSIIAVQMEPEDIANRTIKCSSLVLDNTRITIDDNIIGEDNLYELLNDRYNYYIWFVRWAHESTDLFSPLKPYLIGLRKNFTISQDMLVNSDEDGLYKSNTNNNLCFNRTLTKNFAFSVDRRGYQTEKNIEYKLKIKYSFLIDSNTSKIYTKADYQLYRTGSNGREAPVEGLPNEPIMFFRESVFSKTFDNILDPELGMSLTLTFEDEVPQYDYYNIFGTDSYKINSLQYNYDDGSSTITRREFINEDRFVPIFHKTVDLVDDTAENTDTLVVIPTLKYLKRIDNQTNESMWIFHNASTNENFYSDTLDSNFINISRPLLGRYRPMQLTPGYYDIILNARIWDNVKYIPMKVESMFLLK